jgi:hypothetical protein
LINLRTRQEASISSSCRTHDGCPARTLRWGAGVLKPPAGSVLEMDIPNVAAEDRLQFRNFYHLLSSLYGEIYIYLFIYLFSIPDSDLSEVDPTIEV